MLGTFTLTGIPPAPRGVPQIEVTFDIDANGILHVTARDKATGKEQGIQVVAPNKMTREEIDRKIKEAEEYAAQDKAELEAIETRNNAESLMYTTNKVLRDYKDKIPKDLSERAEKAVQELQEALKGNDLNEIKEKMEALRKVSDEVGASLYSQGVSSSSSGSQPGPGPSGPSNPGSSGASDVNYKVEG